jgi:serine/threonine protein kinase
MINTILQSRYKIIQQLGKGGFGETYIAEDLHIPSHPKPRCVVKRLQPAVIEPEISRLFEQEAQILYNLGKNHDQIPSLSAYFQEGNQFYLIQDLVIGNDLSQEITPSKKLSETYVIKLLQDVSMVLAFVHQNNVIHRDIKPQNIIRRQDGKLLLIDFGAVKQVKQTVLKSGLTSKTISIGTPGYTPSEQAMGRPKYSSDVYALGMTAIQALTGKFPHELPEDNNDEIIWRNLVNVSDNLAIILTKMVKFRSGERYENAGLVLQALNQAFSSVATPQKNQVVIPQVAVTIPSQPAIKLQNSKADFRKLDQLLSEEKWKEADQETKQLILKCVKREKEVWLDVDSCRNFPQEELRIIDQLWLKYSQNRFGFSVQKQIWVDNGGKLDSGYDWDTYRKLGHKVGWIKGGYWLNYSQLTFNANALPGYLPAVFGCVVGGWFIGFFECRTLSEVEWGKARAVLFSLL